ncbi:response regulator transcription factor [Micromonospora sp. KC606]|nr:response regulator transcription factor [Micromonospora sp. KC606]
MVARVLLCDPRALPRIGLRAVLDRNPTIEVVGEAETGEEAARTAERLRPDVVLADAAISRVGGMTLARRLLGEGAASPERKGAAPLAWRPAVVLMIDDLDDEALDALRAGASGILLRSCGADEVVNAIRATMAGEGFLAQRIVRPVIDRISGRDPGRVGAAAATLTRREQEVLCLVAEGLSNGEIGQRLFVGEPTVKYHVSQLLRKLHLRDRLQAAAFAYRNGLVRW